MSASCCCGPIHALCSLSFHTRYRLELFWLGCKCWRRKLGFSPVYVEATWLSRPGTVGAWTQLIILLGWRDVESVAIACLSGAPTLFTRMVLPAHLWGRHDVTMTLAATPRVLRGDFCCFRNRAAWSCGSSSRIALMLERYDCVPDFRTSASLGAFLSHVSSRNRDIGTPRRTEDKTSRTDGGGEMLHFPGHKILGKTRSRAPAGLSLGIRNTTTTFGADAGRISVHVHRCCAYDLIFEANCGLKGKPSIEFV
jgi:hypothetical protein